MSIDKENHNPKVAGSTQYSKYVGIIFIVILVLILTQYFFSQSTPKITTESTIESADTAAIKVNLGGNAPVPAKLPTLPVAPVHIPSVLPPPSFAQDAEQSQQEQTRLKSPSLVYSIQTNSTENHDQNMNGGSGNLGFANQIASAKVMTVQAKRQTNTNYKIFQGKIIPAVLETAINSDLPGMVRAVINEDVYSETGRMILLPKGTRLVGQYNSAIAVGQTRVYILWNRALTPDNIDIALGSPSADMLGQAGMSGDVDTHFWKIFGNSLLLSVIGAAASQVAAHSSGSSTGVIGNPYQMAVTEGILNSSNAVLQTNINIQPTIHVQQGSLINVFVAKDLDFAGAMR